MKSWPASQAKTSGGRGVVADPDWGFEVQIQSPHVGGRRELELLRSV